MKSGRIVLDTDTVVDALRGRADVLAELGQHSPSSVAVAAMTVAELLFGALASRAPEQNQAEVERFLHEVHMVPFGRRAAAAHARIRWHLRAEPIGPNDIVIASCALAADATLITSNTREFARIDGLRVISWRAA